MKIVWDEPKRQANLQKHRLDFADIGEFDWANALVEDARPDASDRRLKALGYFRDGTAVVIFVTLGQEAVSIISFRPASERERRRLPWSRPQS